MYKLFLLLSLSFMFIGCGEDSLTEDIFDNETLSIPGKKHWSSMHEEVLCDTTWTGSENTCEFDEMGLLVSVYQRPLQPSSRELYSSNDYVSHIYDYQWFNTYRELCTYHWDYLNNELYPPSCAIQTYEDLYMLQEAIKTRRDRNE